MHEHIEARRPQPIDGHLQQKHVLKNAAGQTDSGDVCLLSRSTSQLDDQVGHREMKIKGQSFATCASRLLTHNPPQNRGRVENESIASLFEAP